MRASRRVAASLGGGGLCVVPALTQQSEGRGGTSSEREAGSSSRGGGAGASFPPAVRCFERQAAGEALTAISVGELAADLREPRRRLFIFGETHTDKEALRVAEALYVRIADARPCALALEFVDADRRDACAHFSDAQGDAAALFASPVEAARYGPLVHAARARGNRVVAANAPRRIVRVVSAGGAAALAHLGDGDLALLPPLPYASRPLSTEYAARLETTFGENSARRDHLVAAQCLWDAAMAFAVLEHLRLNHETAVFLLCGRFHCEHFLGVVDHLRHYLQTRPDLYAHLTMDRDEFRTIVALPLADLAELTNEDLANLAADDEIKDRADFILFTPDDDDDDILLLQEQQQQQQQQQQQRPSPPKGAPLADAAALPRPAVLIPSS